MNRTPVLLLVSLIALCGCQAGDDATAPSTAETPASTTPDANAAPSAPIAVPDDDDVRSDVLEPIELPPPDAATPPMAEGADITYTCEDGSDLRVTYAAGRANVTLADGGIVPLPLSPQATGQAGGEVYIGEALTLHRLGNVVELQQDEGDRRRCRESGGNA